jgi:dienelactone hydrolase
VTNTKLLGKWLPIWVLGALLLAPPRTLRAAPGLELVTPRGAPIEVLAERPPGKGPFPAIVLGSGSGYHARLPLLEQTARALLRSGVAVYRFNWAYFVRDPDQGKQSESRADEIEDMQTVIARARSAPFIDPKRVFVGGKSLGSIIAWRVFRSDPFLAGALLLTPVCSKASDPPFSIERNYPDLLSEQRPVQWILGDSDPVCEPRALYRFLAGAPRPHKVSLLSGNHSFERGSTPEKTPSPATKRQIQLAAELATEFVANAP